MTFDGLGWNTEVKKEKIEQKEAKETKRTRMRIFREGYTIVSGLPA